MSATIAEIIIFDEISSISMTFHFGLNFDFGAGKQNLKNGSKNKFGRKTKSFWTGKENSFSASKSKKGRKRKFIFGQIFFEKHQKQLKNSLFWPKMAQKQPFFGIFRPFSSKSSKSAGTGSEASLRPRLRLEIGQKLRF